MRATVRASVEDGESCSSPQLVTLLTDQALIAIIVVIAVLVVGGTTGLVITRRRKAELPPAAQPASLDTAEPKVGEDAEEPRDTPTRTLEDTQLPEAPAATIEKPESAQGRLVRLRAGWRGRRARSARGCSRCCRGTSSTKRRGRTSRPR